ncbi:MAG: iron-sulfur cluster repair protein YtfE [Kangiella sp.]|jgi:regulator of cell morphogenesis and NO signaling|nr:iron-sulfur cluster repair protein YtfE [Kangiella sp.]
MTAFDIDLLDKSLGEIARDLPGASAVFFKHGMNFCCRGHQALANSIQEQNLDVEQVLAQLNQLKPAESADYSEKFIPNDELINHILERYHEVHREQLPELTRLAKRVESVHANHPECPTGLASFLSDVEQEMEAHMQKEEQILFPMIQRGMGGLAKSPVAVMRMEHDDHGETLARLEQLAHHFQLPAEACNTWQALYTGLAAFKEDLMNHIHLENNILFERIDNYLGGH